MEPEFSMADVFAGQQYQANQLAVIHKMEEQGHEIKRRWLISIKRALDSEGK